MNLTRRQHEIVEFIREYVLENEYAPTMQEMADYFGVARPTIFEHIETLQAKGVLHRQPLKTRTIELAPEFASQPSALPLIGTIAAGSPIEAIESSEVLDLEDLFRGRPGETFVLPVRGNSMIDEQIRDGDYVIIEKRGQARNGETVVALIEGGDATLKKFYKEKGRIRLQPANPDMEPIYVKDCEVQGIVIGVLRRY